ncbi:MAG: hypothetical protein ABSD38_34980, partial [Syntrophorhabdales bacterium]
CPPPEAAQSGELPWPCYWGITLAPMAFYVAPSGYIPWPSTRRDLRPRRVVVQELRRVEPVSIRANIKDRIKITFDGGHVDSLGQIETLIFNEGRDTITEPEIRIEFPKNITVIDATVSESTNGIADWTGNIAHLKFKFLNAKKEHKHVEKVSIITSGLFDRIRVVGGGEGWSVRHIPLGTPVEQKAAVLRILWGSLVVMVIVFANVFWGTVRLGIAKNELSVRAFVASLPMFTAMAAWVILVLTQIKKLPRGTK